MSKISEADRSMLRKAVVSKRKHKAKSESLISELQPKPKSIWSDIASAKYDPLDKEVQKSYTSAAKRVYLDQQRRHLIELNKAQRDELAKLREQSEEKIRKYRRRPEKTIAKMRSRISDIEKEKELAQENIQKALSIEPEIAELSKQIGKKTHEYQKIQEKTLAEAQSALSSIEKDLTQEDILKSLSHEKEFEAQGFGFDKEHETKHRQEINQRKNLQIIKAHAQTDRGLKKLANFLGVPDAKDYDSIYSKATPERVSALMDAAADVQSPSKKMFTDPNKMHTRFNTIMNVAANRIESGLGFGFPLDKSKNKNTKEESSSDEDSATPSTKPANSNLLFNDEIEQYMKPLEKYGFIGVYMADDLAKIPSQYLQKRGSLIFNNEPDKDPKTGKPSPGQHWLALYWDLRHKNEGDWTLHFEKGAHNQGIYYYDSFGRPPSGNGRVQIKDLMDKIRKKFGIKYETDFDWSDCKEQDMRSQECGWFAMRWLVDKYLERHHDFCSDRESEHEVKEFRKDVLEKGKVPSPNK